MKKKINFKIICTRYRDLQRFTVFLLPYWRMKLLTIILNAVLVPLGLVVPFLTKLMIDKAYGHRDLRLFILLTIIGATVFLLSAIIEGANNYFERKLGLKVNFDLHSKFFQHFQRLPLKFFQDKATGEHIFMFNFDIERLSGMIVNTLPQLILFGGRFFLILAMVFYLNWKIALLGMVFAPLFYIEPYYFIEKRRELLQKEIQSSQSIFVRLEEVFSHIHLVKAFGKEDFEIQNFLRKLGERLALALREIRMGFYSAFAGNSLRKIVLGTLSLYGGYQIIKGRMTLGDLTAVMIYLSQLIGLHNSLSGFLEQLTFNSVACERIQKILETQPEIVEGKDAVRLDLFHTGIEFREVTFSYQAEAPVLQNLSFAIKPGSFIALVGRSGCGKTTLLNLLLRLYEPQKGKISIAAQDIRQIKLDSLRSQIGIALQEPFLWNDSIANNIRYAKTDANLEEIKHAATIAQINDFIESLPHGYNSIVGEMASKISEGQKQRLAIARAVVKNPAILIFDEAMASLDSQTEEKIIKALKKELKSSIVIVVSHRLSTVRNMDEVYFLEAPDKLSIGKHEELLEHNPPYRELFSRQIELDKSYEHR